MCSRGGFIDGFWAQEGAWRLLNRGIVVERSARGRSIELGRGSHVFGGLILFIGRVVCSRKSDRLF